MRRERSPSPSTATKQACYALDAQGIAEIVEASLIDSPRVRKRIILDTAGKLFPFVGRENEAEQLLHNLDHRYADCKSQDKEHETLAHLSGMPGTGKTRMNLEYTSLLKSAISARKERLLRMNDGMDTVEVETDEHLLHSVEECDTLHELVTNATVIHATLNTTYNPGTYEQSLYSTDLLGAFWMRVLYFYLSIGEDMANFMKRFGRYKVDGDQVVQYILQNEGVIPVKQEDGKIVKMLHFGVDEYNMIVDVDSVAYKDGRMRLVSIVKEIQRLMKLFAEYGILITSFFTGTRKRDFDNMFTGTFGATTMVLSSPLSFEESCKLVVEVARNKIPIQAGSLGSKYLPQEELLTGPRLHGISLLGGIPRCIEIFIKNLAINPAKSMPNLMKTVMDEISRRYIFSNFSDPVLTYELIKKSILQHEVGAFDNIGKYKYDTLQGDGLILLERTKSKTLYKVVLPFPWLRYATDSLQSVQYPAAMALSLALDEAVDGKWDSFEKLCMRFWQALILFNDKPGITYGSLAQGATFIPKDADVLDEIIPIDIESIKRDVVRGLDCNLEKQYPDNHDSKLTRSRVFTNCAGASIDVGVKGDGILVGGEMKHSKKDKTKVITAREFEEKFNKSKKEVKDWNEYISGLSENRKDEIIKLVMYCYISNRPYKGSLPLVDVAQASEVTVKALITRSELCAFFGTSITRILCNFEKVSLNHARYVDLVDTEGMGATIAEKVIANRPEGGYTTLEQFHEAVPSPPEVDTYVLAYKGELL